MSQENVEVVEAFYGGFARIAPQQMRAAGDEVAVRLRGWFRGASSAVETEASWAAAFAIRDGRVGGYPDHVNWPKALEAVGLSE